MAATKPDQEENQCSGNVCLIKLAGWFVRGRSFIESRCNGCSVHNGCARPVSAKLDHIVVVENDWLEARFRVW